MGEELEPCPSEESSGECLARMGVDGHKWAREFMRLHKEVGFTIDEDLMIGWFANAIMAGMDEQYRRCQTQIRKEVCEEILREFPDNIRIQLSLLQCGCNDLVINEPCESDKRIYASDFCKLLETRIRQAYTAAVQRVKDKENNQ